MVMKKLAILILALIPSLSFAQGILGGDVRFTEKYGPFHDTYTQTNDIKNRKAVEYKFVREADVIFKRITWQIIDLREKKNLPLYYPIDTLHGRKSFIFALLDGIQNNQYNAFKVPIKNNSFEFDQANLFSSYQEITDIGARTETIPIEIMPGVTRDSVISIRWRPEEIKQILVKEVWYVDKRNSKLECEIIGVCPIREYTVNGQLRRQRLFWVYYPDARQYLSTVPVFNMRNDKENYSFDDVFVFRYFSSYFLQEQNVYNDRMITDYVNGREAQLESDRIKAEIFNFEQDLWEY
jgi:gliding motility associated protien GldN